MQSPEERLELFHKFVIAKSLVTPFLVKEVLAEAERLDCRDKGFPLLNRYANLFVDLSHSLSYIGIMSIAEIFLDGDDLLARIDANRVTLGNPNLSVTLGNPNPSVSLCNPNPSLNFGFILTLLTEPKPNPIPLLTLIIPIISTNPNP